ncbi:MAG TPA: phenylalanine--tRNA ligase subunit beta, partial [Candidatus Cloacimonadota bacterium]|nr:phenylalanine--tRNA ligase subunit beta [Candidatus Cloacimonadota bacterium]
DAPLGVSIVDYLDLSDAVIEVEITPNRADLLGMIGIARDLSALLQKPLHLPAKPQLPQHEPIEKYLQLENRDAEGCPRYLARMIRNVEIKESPDWLKRHLIAIGSRPINNVVDVTNFVMFEMGHPLHAFDYDNLQEHKIVVRRATEKEVFPALDGKTYELTTDDLVIADGKKPSALAGVIGGGLSHITESTRNIILEAACFDYATIRRTSNRHHIFTDSSYRFERNLSAEKAEEVSLRAAELILAVAGGELCAGALDSYPNPKPTWTVRLRPERVRSLLAISIDNSTIVFYLQALGLTFKGEEKGALLFEVPDYRKDLTREADLIEEIIRLYGYNPKEEKERQPDVMNWDKFYLHRKMKDFFVSIGFFEVLNTSFSDPEYVGKLRIPETDKRSNTVKILNPQAGNASIMRSTMIPQLIRNAVYNINHGEDDIKFFELNKIFMQKKDGFAFEPYRLTGFVTGKTHSMHWKDKPAGFDFYEMKGIVDDMLALLHIEGCEYTNSCEPYYLNGSALDVWKNDVCLGSFGKLDPKILAEFDLEVTDFKQDAWILDFSADDLLAAMPKSAIQYREIAKFPTVQRDLSFLISRSIPIGSVMEEIRATNRELLKSVELFDVYQGKQFKEGWHSVSMNIIIGSDEKTLTDEAVDMIINKVIDNLIKKFQIEMR